MTRCVCVCLYLCMVREELIANDKKLQIHVLLVKIHCCGEAKKVMDTYGLNEQSRGLHRRGLDL